MPSPAVDPSVLDTLQIIRAQYPNVPFLALGQTVFWDEPTKAVWRRLLDQFLPGATLIAGVHDTDYFAKTSAHIGDAHKFAALPHNDGATRDLWSAAGELSSLFGSESVPTRAMFLAKNVPFDWLGKRYPGGKSTLYVDKTEAWGWRGIVQTEAHNVIAHDIPILDIKDALLEQLDWGFAESLVCLSDTTTRIHAKKIAAEIRVWVLEFLESCSDSCCLSDLYQTLLPRFYQMLLGSPPLDFQTTSSITLFQFNRQTFHKPRFGLTALFLNPKSRRIARGAYNSAVGNSSSGIYTLEAFGPGAIPFDLVIPNIGRGTIRVTPASIVVETTPQPTVLWTEQPVETLAQLAALLEDRFGPDVALVGKAVTLADMIAAEHLVVFHETASGYTTLTQAMNARLAAHGLTLPLYPIVRLTYPTWDALAAVPPEVTFNLPAHLKAVFGSATIPAREFSARWREIVAGCRRVMLDSQHLPSARALLGYLEEKNGQCWCDKLIEYEQALQFLKVTAAHSDTLHERIEEHQNELHVWQQERADLERRKGEDWRHNVQPLQTALRDCADIRETSRLQSLIDRQNSIRATAFEVPIETARARITATRHLIAEFRRQRRLLERGPEASEARGRVSEIVYEAQLARLELVQSAFLTAEGLEHTQLRPTAWWLPFVDPTGAWFDALAAGTQARLERLDVIE